MTNWTLHTKLSGFFHSKKKRRRKKHFPFKCLKNCIKIKLECAKIRVIYIFERSLGRPGIFTAEAKRISWVFNWSLCMGAVYIFCQPHPYSMRDIHLCCVLYTLQYLEHLVWSQFSNARWIHARTVFFDYSAAAVVVATNLLKIHIFDSALFHSFFFIWFVSLHSIAESNSSRKKINDAPPKCAREFSFQSHFQTYVYIALICSFIFHFCTVQWWVSSNAQIPSDLGSLYDCVQKNVCVWIFICLHVCIFHIENTLRFCLPTSGFRANL